MPIRRHRWFGLRHVVLIGVMLALPQAAFGASFTVTSSQDTYLKEKDKNKNYGDDKELPSKPKNKDNKRPLFQYDLSAIPVGATITSATARFLVRKKDDSGDPVNVFRVTDSWTETGATWNNTANDYDSSTVYGSFVPDAEGWVTVDLTILVQAWVDNDFANDGLMLISTSNDKESKFTSKEWDIIAERPWLEILTAEIGVGGGGPGSQVCQVQQVGNEEFRGISGSSDDDVIAVGKKGTIYRFDGSTWTSMTSPTDKELNDVEVVNAATAFAVGKDGRALQLVGGTWISHTGFTNDDLFGVWSASASEAYVVGEHGTIFVYDGISWTDATIPAGTDNEKLQDAWGDAYSFYALGDKGTLYRYDRVTATWDAPDERCDFGGGFEDIWGNGNGDLYLVRKKRVYLHNGASCNQVATAGDNLEGVYGWTANGDVYAVGKKGVVLHYDGSTWTETEKLAKEDFKDVWVSPNGNAYYVGKGGELTVCNCTDCDQTQLLNNHDGYGINCQNEVMQVQVIEPITGTPRNDYNEQITLDTQTGFGTWSLIFGSGAFIDASANDGLATYDWPLGESSAEFELSYPEGPANFDIDAYQTSYAGIRDSDSEGNIEFSPNGFTVTSAPLGNPPPAIIPPFNTPQIAGTDFGVYLAAFGQTPNHPACGIIENYAGPKNLKFWMDYVDPASGTRAVTVDGNPVGLVEAAATTQAVTFVNGQAAVTGKYKDVGRIQILSKDDNSADPDLPNGIRGATANFVVKPHHFELTNIEDGASNPNPAAADASGPRFIAAGEPFAATVTVFDAEGDVTPNYGQESGPETVQLTANLVDPAAGNNPPVSATMGFGAFVNGQAIGNDFMWPEVGIVTLRPSVGDGTYFDAGDVVGFDTGNVGRFVAHHFTTSLNTPEFGTGCPSGSFTYLGAGFGYSVAPVITVTARAAAGTTTQNYAGAFFKIDNASLANRTYTAALGSLVTGGLPSTAVDPAPLSLGAGVGTLTFSAGSGLYFNRGAPQSVFDASIQLSLDVIDADGAAALSNPAIFGDPGGIGFSNGPSQRYGRIRISNVLGSELVNLSVPMRAEYFVNAATGFVRNTADSCTGGVSTSFSAFTEDLAPGETCVFDIGSPGDSGAGCAAAGPFALRYREPPLGGDFNLNLQAPGNGNSGSVKVTADVPGWLEFDWDFAAPGLEDPDGTATFGIFDGENQQIYMREIY